MGSINVSKAFTTSIPLAGAGSEYVERQPQEIVTRATIRQRRLLLHFGSLGDESISAFEIKPEYIKCLEEKLPDMKGRTFQEVMTLNIS